MYVRLCEGLKDKGKLIPATDNIYNYIKNTKKDYYTSVYHYNDKQKQKFEKSGTIAGITNVTTNKIIFDFDSKNLELAKKDAVETLDRLKKKNIPEDSINIFFSGNKGYHLILDTDNIFTPEQAKRIAVNLAGDLPTFDSVVYNPARVFRVANTRHPISKLNKIPIHADELRTLNEGQIRMLADNEYNPIPYVRVTLSDDFLSLDTDSPKETEVKSSESLLLSELDLEKRPKELSPWKYALEQGFFPEGQRSNALIILASTYKKLKYSKVKCYHSLKAAAELQAKRFGQEKFSKKEIYENIINQVYGNSWQGGTFSEDNFPTQIQDYLIKLGVPRQTAKDEHENYVMNIEKGFGAFSKYAEHIDENTMKFGIKELDNLLRVQVGHLIGVLAPPGIGKTSMALTLLNNTSKQGINSFFGSYDMADKILIQKLVQRETGLDSDKLFDIYRNGNIEEINKFKKILSKNYANVSFCFKAGQTVKELKDSIEQEEAKLGTEIKLIVVDYLELIRTASNDPTIASMEAIQGLREIANEGRVVVCLLQPNKVSSKPDEPLLSYNSAKGSSAIAQAVTSMITAHRPGYNPDDPSEDVYFGINVVKNRMGPLGKADFAWEGLTGKITSLEDIEREALEELRERKKLDQDGDI